MREVGFAGLFGFKYSRRPSTPALRLGDDVPEAEKQSRLLELFEVSEAQLRAHLASLVGTRQQVLLEGPSRPGSAQLVGRTRRNEIVHVASTEGAGPGAIATVEIIRANNHSLEGRIESLDRPLASLPAPTATFRRVALPVVTA